MTDHRIECVGIEDFDVEPDSVDLILTDPPYPREFLWTWRALAEFAERVLKPGGSVLAMSGQMFLPQIMSDFADFDLDFVWMIGYVMSGPNSRLWQERLYGTWKPILWYAKGKPDAPRKMTRDSVVASGRDKRFHHWGQDVGTFDHLTRNFSRRGDLVCDPFLGGGTTALAVLANGRRFAGCDVDPKAIQLTETRIAALDDYRRARLTQPASTDTPDAVGNTADEPEEVDDEQVSEEAERSRGGDRGSARDGREGSDQGRDGGGGEAGEAGRPDAARDGRLDDLQPGEAGRHVRDPGEGSRRADRVGRPRGSGSGGGVGSGGDAEHGRGEGSAEVGGEARSEADPEEADAEAEGCGDRVTKSSEIDGDRAAARSSSVGGKR